MRTEGNLFERCHGVNLKPFFTNSLFFFCFESEYYALIHKLPFLIVLRVNITPVS